MGREIRRVTPDWVHPRYKNVSNDYNYKDEKLGNSYHPMEDEPFEDALAEFMQEYRAWQAGDHGCIEYGVAPWVWDDGSCPDPAFYRHRRWTEPRQSAGYVVQDGHRRW